MPVERREVETEERLRRSPSSKEVMLSLVTELEQRILDIEAG